MGVAAAHGAGISYVTQRPPGGVKALRRARRIAAAVGCVGSVVDPAGPSAMETVE